MKSLFDKFYNWGKDQKDRITGPGGNSRRVPEGRQTELKIVFVGESGTGVKTCFITRYVDEYFNDDTIVTGSIDYSTKHAVVRGVDVDLTLWEVPGQDAFVELSKTCFNGADGIVVGYDITRSDSLDTARQRYSRYAEEYPNAFIMVIGHKVDLENDREVSREDGESFAREINAVLFYEGTQIRIIGALSFSLLFYIFYSVCKVRVECQRIDGGVHRRYS